MIGYFALGPLGLLVSALGLWSLYNAGRYRRVRFRGWIKRDVEPKFFWFAVGSTLFATLWFGLIGIFVSAHLMGLV